MVSQEQLSQLELDDTAYEEEDPEGEHIFYLGSMVAIHQVAKPPEVDPTISSKKQIDAGLDQGVLKGKFDKWEVQLNWRPVWTGKIPPRHLRVLWNGEEIGVLSPYMTARTCPTCGLGGWRDKSRKIGLVIPSQPCPRCHTSDWKGSVVTEDDFEKDCAAWLAIHNADDTLYDVLQTAGIGRAD